MNRITIIYPHLTSYTLPIIKGLADVFEGKIDVIFSNIPENSGFGVHSPFYHPKVNWIQLEEIYPFGNQFGMYQKGLLKHIFNNKPEAIEIWANPRYLSFWGVLIIGRILGIKVFARGHGLYKKTKINIYYKLMYKTIGMLSYKYICYTPIVKNSLLKIIRPDEKLPVIFNTLYNSFSLPSHHKTGKENGIFYLGRLRSSCGVDVLIQCISKLNNNNNFTTELHIIGDGELRDYVRKKSDQFPWIMYYGGIYDQRIIRDISKSCRLGCVPGTMGLNVVHMMSLSLPIITHSQLNRHGPEAEYIIHNFNGFLVNESNDESSIVNMIKEVWKLSTQEIMEKQKNAFVTYQNLSTPPYHDRLLDILND